MWLKNHSCFSLFLTTLKYLGVVDDDAAATAAAVVVVVTTVMT